MDTHLDTNVAQAYHALSLFIMNDLCSVVLACRFPGRLLGLLKRIDAECVAAGHTEPGGRLLGVLFRVSGLSSAVCRLGRTYDRKIEHTTVNFFSHSPHTMNCPTDLSGPGLTCFLAGTGASLAGRS